jgi:TRAP-type C4-dicarboxylate transport system permease large subunit
MSLFLAGYAFKKPLGQIVRETMPYFLVQLAILLLVTWLPGLTSLLRIP